MILSYQVCLYGRLHIKHQNPSITEDFIDSQEKREGGEGEGGGGVGNPIHIEEDL